MRVARIDYRHADGRPRTHVGRLDSIDTHVDQHGVAVVVDPDRRHMRRAVGAKGGEVSERITLQEVDELSRNCEGHGPKVNPARLILWPMAVAAPRPPVPAGKLRIGLVL